MTKPPPTKPLPAKASTRRPVLIRALPVIVSAVAWAVLCAAFPPIDQDFPLNDDWAFARGAFAFMEGKGIHYHNWASMPPWHERHTTH
jgi:hypothetical protein